MRCSCEAGSLFALVSLQCVYGRKDGIFLVVIKQIVCIVVVKPVCLVAAKLTVSLKVVKFAVHVVVGQSDKNIFSP